MKLLKFCGKSSFFLAFLFLIGFLTSFTVVAPHATSTIGGLVELPLPPIIINQKPQEVDRSREMAAFEAKNDDCVGWLYIPGTDIDDEIVQAKDNDFYLRRTSMGYYYSEHGCYFVDYRNHMSGELDRNTIIYGHNIWDDGEKFSQLLAYEDWDHFSSYPYLYLQTETGMHVYRVVAAYYTFTDFYYIRPDASDKIWSYILRESLLRSEHLTDLDLPADGKYLTLSTCCYRYTDAYGNRRKDQRFVVLGMEIDSENPPRYQLPEKNPSPKPPAA